MKWLITSVVLVLLAAYAISAPPPPTIVHQVQSNQCGQVLNTLPSILCIPFDAPAGNGIREGDLDSNVWGVSRASGSAFDGTGNQWGEVTFLYCNATTPTVIAQNDIKICNGQLREAVNDNVPQMFEAGTVVVLAMYPKQRFDFTGRTGTVSFDVSNDTSGTHGAWPEFWLSNLPVPAPFDHFGTFSSLPQYAFGVRLAAGVGPGNIGACPNGNNIGNYRWTVDSIVAVRNYVLDDEAGFGTQTGMVLNILDCVIMAQPDTTGLGVPTGSQQMNHVEIRLSQNQIDVYGWDAGVKPTSANSHHLATGTNINMPLTNGLVWIEDVHYNADKGDPTRPSEREHTFSWDNLAFDGPFGGRDFTFDAPDNTTPDTNGSIDLGKIAGPGAYTSWTINNIPAVRNQGATVILFNLSNLGSAPPEPTSINVIVNGHAHSAPWPYPSVAGQCPVTNGECAWHTYPFIIPSTDLVTGTNTVQIGTNITTVIANVDIALAAVPGAVPVLPGSKNCYPGTC